MKNSNDRGFVGLSHATSQTATVTKPATRVAAIQRARVLLTGTDTRASIRFGYVKRRVA
jgi:hypothetical protein